MAKTPPPPYLAEHAHPIWERHVGQIVLTVDETVKAAAMCTALAEADRASRLSQQSQPIIERAGHVMVNPATKVAQEQYEKASSLASELAHVLNPLRKGAGRSKLAQHGPIVIRAISRGFTQREAAALAGIGESTLYAWLDRGATGKNARSKADNRPYVEFYEQVQHARTRGLLELVDIVWEAAKHGKPELAMQLLKVLDPKKYSERYMIEELKARVDVLGVEAFATDDDRADVDAETSELMDHITEYLSASG